MRLSTSTHAALPQTQQHVPHQELLQRVEMILTDSPLGHLPIAAVYESLPLDVRRAHVRPHRTLLNAIHAYEASSSNPAFHVSQDGLTVCLAGVEPSIPENNQTSSSAPMAPSSPQTSDEPTIDHIKPVMSVPESEVIVPLNPLLFTFPSGTRLNEASSYSMRSASLRAAANDFYFGVDLAKFPPPAPQFEPSKATMEEGLEAAIASSINVASLASYIPLFFVPVSEVVQALPEGYTEEHIDHYLASVKTIQIVTVASVRYIRISGGFGQVSLDGAADAAELFARYRPDPDIIPAFEAAFEGIRDKWMPLPLLLQRADARAVERLPYQGPASILYFAQMQHLFNFSPEGDGAVLFRPPLYAGLSTDTSPVPFALSKCIQSLPSDGFISADALLDKIPKDIIVGEILKYFPSVEYFIRSHGGVFYATYDAEGSAASAEGESARAGKRDENVTQEKESDTARVLQVCRARYKERIDRKALPLHEQLDIALREKRKKDCRSIRRKMAMMNHSDSPLTDRATLAKEIHKALPRRGHVKLKTFMRGTLPDDILNFMPKNYQKFFSGFPDLFQVFEIRHATNWCIGRAGQQSPRGVLKKDFSDEECLRVVAQYISRAGPRSISTISLNIPAGAAGAVRTRHVDLFNFVRKYPDNFSIVMPIDQGNAKSAAIVHLSKLPNESIPNEELGEELLDDVEDGEL